MSLSQTLDEARVLIARGLEKAADLHLVGAIAVVDAGGNVVSTSRMDGGSAASVYVARAKAATAAVLGRPTAMLTGGAADSAELAAELGALLPRKLFSESGGMPIWQDGRLVGGIGAGGGIGPYTEIPGVGPEQLMVNGMQVNAEDLVICTALGVPYESQHGDRPLRLDNWPSGSEVAVAVSLAEAVRCADRAIAAAGEAGVRIGVAVVDEVGRLIQADRMDGSPLISAELAEAKALTALKFQRATSGLAEEFQARSGRLRAIERIIGTTILAVGGGVPIIRKGRLVGGIGVSGSGAVPGSGAGRRDEDLARAAAEE